MYKLSGFCPSVINGYNDYAFSINLENDIVRKITNIRNIDMDHFDMVVNVILKQIGVDDFPSRPILFYENTFLATNFTVAGNACGLDVDRYELEAILRNEPFQSRCLTYFPHNIDTMKQAYALTAVYSYWYEYCDSFMYAFDRGLIKSL